MSRRIAVLTTTLGLMLVGLAAPHVALAGDPCFHSLDRPAPSTGSTASVSIGDCVFLPTVAHVPIGATVEWRNTSAQAHEVVGANLTWGAHDKPLENADTIVWTFDEPGVYAYSCMLHPGMTGAIVVGVTAAWSDSPGAAAAGAETTDGESAPGGPAIESGSPMAGLAAAGGVALVGVLAVSVVLRRRAVSAPARPETRERSTILPG